ncbi:hypothetical protein FACS1894139_07340 [Planctomycetales bacterium]|nr:hypothetical protein FACS1894107_11650 [Planctomycetales bacterium]GHT04720.1 hypothetical protein FACS1894139_07340 [Planctomycetales bacterium]
MFADTACYQPLPKEKAEAIADFLYDCLGDLPAALGIKDLRVSKPAIAEIIDLVERRRVYFRIFHGIEMGELNETALYCFWFIKFAPLYHPQYPNWQINLLAAMKLLIAFVRRRHPAAPLPKPFIQKIAYAFRYRDLSKEAVMLLLETLVAKPRAD